MNPTTDEMCREVYEAITGKCWHGRKSVKRFGRNFTICPRCKHLIRSLSETGSMSGPWYDAVMVAKVHNYLSSEWKVIDRLPNPDLAKSLDAWAEHIWPVMSDEQKAKRDNILMEMYADDKIEWITEATPMHHLEAAYAMIKGVK